LNVGPIYVPTIDLALGAALAISGALSLILARRGGRFRGLPGWAGFWVVFAGILVCLSRAPTWVSLPLLGLILFAALRTYFFVAPSRPRDRLAVMAAYLAVPFALFSARSGSSQTFLATVPIVVFLLFPALLSMRPGQKALFDAMGRILLGVILFVFCAAHLGLMVHQPAGVLELFGILALATELPRRLAGRLVGSGSWFRPASAVLAGAALSTALGFWLGPSCGLVEEDAARAGLLLAIAVTSGAFVAEGLSRDAGISAGTSRVGRGAFLDRCIPVVYAAPVFFHYLDYFA
jgi:phosphatidate cytidylyltransferase